MPDGKPGTGCAFFHRCSRFRGFSVGRLVTLMQRLLSSWFLPFVSRFWRELVGAAFALFAVVRFGWLSPLPVVLASVFGFYAVLFARRWLAEDAQRTTVRAAAAALVAAGLTETDGSPPRISLEPAPVGWLLFVATPLGRSDADVYGKAGALAAALRCDVEPLPERGNPGHALFALTEPNTERLPDVYVSPLLVGTPRDLSKPVPVGVDEQSAPVSLLLWSNSVLVAGSPRSGKSVFLWSLLVGAALDPSCVLCVVDLKPHGIETADIADRAAVVATTNADALALFRSILLLIDQRNAKLLALRLKKVPEHNREDFPPIVVVVDEAAQFRRDDDGKAALEALQEIVAVGAASGVTVVLATQKPSGEAIPTDLRDLFALRYCFRVGNAEHGKTVLGVARPGVEPWNIPATVEARGIGYGYNSETGAIARFRGALMTETQIRAVLDEATAERSRWLLARNKTEADFLPVAPSLRETAPKPRQRRRK
jgi:S-DNA-T family DNA segregation ATPase FtsK/SpoIIIE